MRAYCNYTKHIDFLFFSEFFLKAKISGVSVASRRQSYWLNILENESRVGHIYSSARPAFFSTMLNFRGDMQAYFAYRKRIDFLSFCKFF